MPAKTRMRFNLKLLLLLVTLCAIILAWNQVRQRTIAAQSQSLANGANYRELVPETENRHSSLYLDGVGVTHAVLAGPEGYAALRKRLDASNQITGLTFTSTDAFRLFDAREFPNLNSLTLRDLDYTTISLSSITPLKRLQRLEIEAYKTSAIPILATLPEMPRPIHLDLRTDKLDSFDGFPQLKGVTKLVLNVQTSAAEMQMLQERLPACDIHYDTE
jgi:hypothetical protein